MATYNISEGELAALRGKTILLTGCASGIGYETARIAHRNGANLILGDWDEEKAQELLEKLGSQRVVFCKTDVSKWDQILKLFHTGIKRFGNIDSVISNAGLNSEDLFNDSVDSVTGDLLAPDLKSLEINMVAQYYIVRCANYYFSQDTGKAHQIIMTASAASYIDTPPLAMYSGAKAGILGIMRSLRTVLIKRNITINVVAPWMTVTPMIPDFITKVWGDLPSNQPGAVGKALLLPIVREDINGKGFFIAGNKIIDLEDTVREKQPQWMGQELSDKVNEGQRRMGIE